MPNPDTKIAFETQLFPVAAPPEDGTQFVAVWRFNDQLWAGTYKFLHGALYYYDGNLDDYVLDEGFAAWSDNTFFFVAN